MTTLITRDQMRPGGTCTTKGTLMKTHREPGCTDPANCCNYQEPHRHGFDCDETCTECRGRCHPSCPAFEDPVNHPSHYTNGPLHSTCGDPIECIDVVQDRDFLLGNTIKYLWRAGLKGPALEDLQKARWYLDRAITRLEAQHQEDLFGGAA